MDEASGGSFIDRIVIFRKQFAMDMGVVVPTVRLRDNALINPNQYVIKIKGEEVARGEVLRITTWLSTRAMLPKPSKASIP